MSDTHFNENQKVHSSSEKQHGLGMEELLEAVHMDPEDRSQLENIRERVQSASKAMRAAIVE